MTATASTIGVKSVEEGDCISSLEGY